MVGNEQKKGNQKVDSREEIRNNIEGLRLKKERAIFTIYFTKKDSFFYQKS